MHADYQSSLMYFVQGKRERWVLAQRGTFSDLHIRA